MTAFIIKQKLAIILFAAFLIVSGAIIASISISSKHKIEETSISVPDNSSYEEFGISSNSQTTSNTSADISSSSNIQSFSANSSTASAKSASKNETTPSPQVSSHDATSSILAGESDELASNIYKTRYIVAKLALEADYNAKIKNYTAQISDLSRQVTTLGLQQLAEEKQLKEEYSNMGLLNSGAYQTALQGVENKYTSQISPLQSQLDKLYNDKSDLEYSMKNNQEELIQEYMKTLF